MNYDDYSLVGSLSIGKGEQGIQGPVGPQGPIGDNNVCIGLSPTSEAEIWFDTNDGISGEEIATKKFVEATNEELSSRLDNLIISNGDGNKDSELIDARNGEATLGNKIRKIDESLDKMENRENWVSVFDFGAKCDGITDDSDALQKAINAINTKTTSKGQWKRVLYIPAVMRIDSPTKIVANFGQFRICGNSLNNSKIVFTHEDGGLLINNTGNDVYEVEINDIKIEGNNVCKAPLTIKKCVNLYLNRVHVVKWAKDGYGFKIIDCGLIWFNGLVIDGDVPSDGNYSIRNGLLIDSCGYLKISGVNAYNLNNLITFKSKCMNFELTSSWIEHVNTVVKVERGITDLRYMNVDINKNTIDNGSYSNIVNFSLINFETTQQANMWNSYINVTDNYFYMPSTVKFLNDTLINIDDCASDGVVFISYKGNHYANFSFSSIGAYVFKLNSKTSAKSNVFRIIDVSVLHESDYQRITDNTKMIKSMINCVSGGGYLTAPNGIYLTSNPAGFGHGNIYYDNGEFYCGYNGSIKQLPKASESVINYSSATDVQTLLTDLNKLITALKKSKVIN